MNLLFLFLTFIVLLLFLAVVRMVMSYLHSRWLRQHLRNLQNAGNQGHEQAGDTHVASQMHIEMDYVGKVHQKSPPFPLPGALVDGSSCAVCIEELLVGDMVTQLPCRHLFHTGCLDPWLRRGQCLCPLCKADVLRPSLPSPVSSVSAASQVTPTPEETRGAPDDEMVTINMDAEPRQEQD